jgi:hypothetical protein
MPIMALGHPAKNEARNPYFLGDDPAKHVFPTCESLLK